jgi:hypothetical protein
MHCHRSPTATKPSNSQRACFLRHLSWHRCFQDVSHNQLVKHAYIEPSEGLLFDNHKCLKAHKCSQVDYCVSEVCGKLLHTSYLQYSDISTVFAAPVGLHV